MNDTELLAVLIETLQSITPEVEGSELRQDRPLRQQVDLDSMDWLNFLIGLSGKLAVEIPEADYRRLGTVNELVAYLNEARRRAG